jgi:hypothetical protein
MGGQKSKEKVTAVLDRFVRGEEKGAALGRRFDLK